MSPRVRTRHGEVTAELAWSGSGSRSKITPAVGRTIPIPPPPPPTFPLILLIIIRMLVYQILIQSFNLSFDELV
ncbi:hypothetical protein Hanom_Chr09g00829711 [Helianthus anomalus]